MPGNLPRIDLSGLIRDEIASGLETELAKQGALIIADWAVSWRGRVGLLLIPSKPRVFYEILLRRNELSNANTDLIRIAQHDIKLELFLRQVAAKNQIPIVSALNDVVTATEKDSGLYPSFDGHPLKAGYFAYAASARRIVEQLELGHAP